MEERPKVKKQPAVRRTRKEITKLLKEYERMEGTSVADYCKTRNISKANFYNWQKRHGSQAIKERVISNAFIPVELSASSPVISLFAEAKGIRFYQVVPADYLKALLS